MLSLPVCVCLCGCVCTCVLVYKHMCTRVCGGRKTSVSCHSSDAIYLISLRQVLSLAWNLVDELPASAYLVICNHSQLSSPPPPGVLEMDHRS